MKKILIGILSVVFATTCFGAGINVDRDTVLAVKGTGAEGSLEVRDESPMGHVVTQIGTAQLSTAQSAIGSSSGLLDGNSDWFSVPTSSDFDLGSGDFCLEGRYRFDTTGSGQTFIARWGQESSGDASWMFCYETDVLKLYGTATGSGTPSTSVSWTPSADTWYAIACTRSSGTVRFFVDGTQVGSNQSFSTDLYDNSWQVTIGSYDLPGGGYYFDGYVDEVRISKGVARYTSGYTPAELESDANTSLLLHMDTHDKSGDSPYNTSKVATFNGTASIQPGSPYSYIVDPDNLVAHYKMDDNLATTAVDDEQDAAEGTLVNAGNTNAIDDGGAIGLGALHLDGTNDHVQMDGLITDIAAMTTGTANYWVYIDADGGAYMETFSMMRDTGGNPGTYWNFTLDFTTNDGIWTSLYMDNVEMWDWTSAADVTDAMVGKWSMITITHDGTAPKIYLDGVDITDDGTWNTSTNKTHWWKAVATDATYNVNSCNFGLEEYDGTDYYPLDGSIDELQIYSSALTAAQVAELYQNSCSLWFDGDSDYVTYATDNGFEIMQDVNTERTISFWAKLGSLNSNENCIISCGTQDGTIERWALRWRGNIANDPLQLFGYWGGGYKYDETMDSILSDTRWHHYVIYCSGDGTNNYYQVYFDGECEGYVTATDVQTFGDALGIGAVQDGNNFFEGNISDLIITYGNPLGCSVASDESDTIAVPDAPLSYTAEEGGARQVIILC